MAPEPADRSIVYGRHRDHWIAGYVWHRDDREGHGDPVDAPERWWSHGHRRWVSWPEVVAYARLVNLELRRVELVGEVLS